MTWPDQQTLKALSYRLINDARDNPHKHSLLICIHNFKEVETIDQFQKAKQVLHLQF
jgi:hypothetical protein